MKARADDSWWKMPPSYKEETQRYWMPLAALHVLFVGAAVAVFGLNPVYVYAALALGFLINSLVYTVAALRMGFLRYGLVWMIVGLAGTGMWFYVSAYAAHALSPRR